MVGASSLRVKNINNFTEDHAVQVGKTGEEQSEIVTLGASPPSGTALNLSGTTAYEAESLGRNFIGIDIQPKLIK